MQLTISDFLLCAFLAFLVTFSITRIVNMFNIVVIRQDEINEGKHDLNTIIKKCYSLFPKEDLNFHGENFKRGMTITIVTNQMKIFKGELIGVNSDNKLCVLTQKHIISQEIKNIVDIKSAKDLGKDL